MVVIKELSDSPVFFDSVNVILLLFMDSTIGLFSVADKNLFLCYAKVHIKSV